MPEWGEEIGVVSERWRVRNDGEVASKGMKMWTTVGNEREQQEVTAGAGARARRLRRRG